MKQQYDPKYDQFFGRTISVIETDIDTVLRIGDRTYHEKEIALEANEPTIKEIEAMARQDNLDVRVWLPRSIGTMDFRFDRLNIHINKVNGEYQIVKIALG